MKRRQLLTGMAAGIPLLAGCSSLLGGNSVIDSSELSTYSNKNAGYSVKYPSEWSKSEGRTTVQFKHTSEDDKLLGFMVAQAVPGKLISMSRDEYMNKIKQIYKKGSEEFSTSDTEEIDLPNDHTGKAVTMTIDTSSGGDSGLLSSDDFGPAKGRGVFASGDKYLYAVMVFVHEDNYGGTESAIEDILSSLTINS